MLPVFPVRYAAILSVHHIIRGYELDGQRTIEKQQFVSGTGSK